jgi:hypothetical protein
MKPLRRGKAARPRTEKVCMLKRSPASAPFAAEEPPEFSPAPMPVIRLVSSSTTSEVPRSCIIVELKISAVIGTRSRERLVPVSEVVFSAW